MSNNDFINNPSRVFKDYSLKIKNKAEHSQINNLDVFAKDINNLVIYLNYCFNNKNNFFVENFNTNNIHPIYLFYNQIKTNIFSKNCIYDEIDIFENIDKNSIKTIKFILNTYINNYEDISNNPDNEHFACQVDIFSMINCVGYLSKYFEHKNKS